MSNVPYMCRHLRFEACDRAPTKISGLTEMAFSQNNNNQYQLPLKQLGGTFIFARGHMRNLN